MSSFQEKVVSDELLSNLQFSKRKESHNTPSAHDEIQHAVGDLVILRNGKNKVKCRELFQILDIYFY